MLFFSLCFSQLLQQATSSSNLGAFSGIQQMAGEILICEICVNPTSPIVAPQLNPHCSTKPFNQALDDRCCWTDLNLGIRTRSFCLKVLFQHYTESLDVTVSSTVGSGCLSARVCVIVCQNVKMNWDLTMWIKSIISTAILLYVKASFVPWKKSLSHLQITSSVRLVSDQIIMIWPINGYLSSAFYIFTLPILKQQKNQRGLYLKSVLITICPCHEFCQIYQEPTGN